MTSIIHHVPDALMRAYAAGSLPYPFALVVATNVSLCLDCRGALEMHEAVGGIVLETGELIELSKDLKSGVLARLDAPAAPPRSFRRSGIFPGPLMEALDGRQPRWKSPGLGVRQSILSADQNGSVRLLHIPPGHAVPDNSHNGLELTLVLQGGFSDEAVEHTPCADPGEPCIRLAATDAPLRFTAPVPRLLQPLFRI